MKKLIPYFVTRKTISWDVCMLNDDNGYTEVFPPLDQESIINMECVSYDDVPQGYVFTPCDDEREYVFEEPSCFMVKRKYGNWYLTGNHEQPIGVDREGHWDVVLMVV